MAGFFNANITVTKLDATPGGTLTAYSQYISNIELSSPRDVKKLARGGGNAKSSLVGALEQDGTIEFWYDSVFVDALRAHNDQSTPVTCSIEIQPQGTGSTLPKRTFEAFLHGLKEQLNADDPAKGAVDFTVDGAITTTAQS